LDHPDLAGLVNDGRVACGKRSADKRPLKSFGGLVWFLAVLGGIPADWPCATSSGGLVGADGACVRGCDCHGVVYALKLLAAAVRTDTAWSFRRWSLDRCGAGVESLGGITNPTLPRLLGAGVPCNVWRRNRKLKDMDRSTKVIILVSAGDPESASLWVEL